MTDFPITNSTLRRRTPLRPGSGPAQHTRIKRSGRLKVRRVSKRFAKRRCKPFTDWLREQPCFLTGLRSGDMVVFQGQQIRVTVDPAHLVRSRACGADDLGFAVPLAHHLHDSQHGVNGGIKTFRRRHGLTEEGVKQVAELYAAEWRATQKGEQ